MHQMLIARTIALTLFFITTPLAAQTIHIADASVPKADIVVATDASDPVRHASEELAFFLNKVTGAAFIITDHAIAGNAHIFVGPKAAKSADPNFSTDKVGNDGIIIRSVGSDLILAGPEPRGTLYAVYSFLEDQIGCRWWTASASFIPDHPSLSVSNLDIAYTPPLEYRDSFWFDAFDADWAVRNKSNGNATRLDQSRGGKISYIGFVHTAYQLIPPDKYFEQHPEWFSLLDGKRTWKNAQLCLSNEELRFELVKNLKALLRANPDAKITSVSQNDNHNNCQCDECRAIDEEEGSPSGLLLRFVNAVAADIEDEFPEVAVSTLAYQYTRHAPKITRPRDNVIVRLCSIECSFSKPLTDDRNQSFRDDIIAWSALTDRLYIWDYVTNFRHYLLPHANVDVLGPNIRFFADHHAKGILEQGGYNSQGTEMAPLRAWVIAKLLWDPTQDAPTLIRTFLDGYFGPASPHINAYLDLLANATDNAEDYVGFYDRAENINALSLDFLTQSLDLFTLAEDAVADQPELLDRVRIAKLPLIYTFLVRWNILQDQASQTNTPWPVADDIRAVHRQFLTLASLAQVTRLGESYTLDHLQETIDAIANHQP